jgi:membrane dipeptidase
VIIVDGHRDIAYDAINFGRDYRSSVAENRARERQTDWGRNNGDATTGLPDALRGNVALTFATLFVEPASYIPWGGMSSIMIPNHPHYETPQQAHDQALAQLAYYKTLDAESDLIKLIYTQRDLDSVLAQWTGDAPADQPRQQGLVVLMEGADPVLEPSQFGEWYERGVRVLGTSWSRTRYAGGTNAPGGLTDLGKALLKEMSRYNALLDLSHMAEQACMESFDLYEGVIVATHALPRHFSNTDRHLSNEALRQLAARDGVIGIVLINSLWQPEDITERVPFERVIEAIDYVCQLTGSAAHVGLGTDWYAGASVKTIPEGFDSLADLPRIGEALTARGYAPADVEAILSGNFIRKLRQTLPA